MIIKGVEILAVDPLGQRITYVVGEKYLTGNGVMAEVKVISFDDVGPSIYFDNGEISIFFGLKFMVWGIIENKQQKEGGQGSQDE